MENRDALKLAIIEELDNQPIDNKSECAEAILNNVEFKIDDIVEERVLAYSRRRMSKQLDRASRSFALFCIGLLSFICSVIGAIKIYELVT